jgi:hypothetical protein
MSSLLKWARAPTRRAPSPPLRFPTSGFDIISDAQALDKSSTRVSKRDFIVLSILEMSSRPSIKSSENWDVG